MKKTSLSWILSLVLLAAGLASFHFANGYRKESAVHAMPTEFRKFKMSDSLPKCGVWKEHMPSVRDPAAYRLYIDARNVWRGKVEWQFTADELIGIFYGVQKAADLGDWGARALMAHFYLYGLGPLKSNNVLKPNPKMSVEIARSAVQAGQPWGFYDLGVAYEHGYGGVYRDLDLAWSYYRKAAELGSPEAQMAFAQVYNQARRFDDEVTMQQCAYRQGHGPAAYELGMTAKVQGRFKEAIAIFQEGVKFGDSKCAVAMWMLFKDGWSHGENDNEEALKLLGIGIDLERSNRYWIVSEALKINPDMKLARLDHVVPLPPEKLPTWSGVIDALELETNEPPRY